MRVLAIGAHPDDVELAAGATLAKHADAGDDVYILVLTCGVTSRYGYMVQFQNPREPRIPEQIAMLKGHAAKASEIIGAELRILDFPDQGLDQIAALLLTQTIESHIKLVKPDVVYTHSLGDVNKDHRIVAECTAVATRPLPGSTVRRVLAYEVSGSGALPHPNVFVSVEGEPMKRKCEALERYTSEMREPPHPRSMEGILALAMCRGMSVGVQECEAFELVRSIE